MEDIKKIVKIIENNSPELAAEEILLFIASSQRELLFTFEKWKTNHIINATDEWRYANVDLFLNKQ